jgi:prepilin signal peptidase PulO-like enzyme (type II secretory pathway)
MIFAVVVSAMLGAIIASFVSVVVERMNTGQSWMVGRSKCSSCAKELKSYDTIPIVSWLVALGACRSCGSRIPVELLISEILLAGVFAVSYLHIGLSLKLIVFLLFVTVLFGLVLYDMRHTIVPSLASGALLVLSCIFLLLNISGQGAVGVALMTAGGISFAFFLLHVLSGGRAMGLGDTPVVLALSLLTAPYALGGVLLSFWIGAVVGIGILVLRRGGSTMGTEVPFVPFLALGYLLAFFLTWNPFILI